MTAAPAWPEADADFVWRCRSRPLRAISYEVQRVASPQAIGSSADDRGRVENTLAETAATLGTCQEIAVNVPDSVQPNSCAVGDVSCPTLGVRAYR